MGVAAGISKRRIRGGDNLILRSGWDFVFDQRERERELWLIRATLFHFVAEMENRFVVFFTLERDSSFFVYVVLSMLAGWEDKILISFDYREREPYKDRSKASRNLVLEMEKLIFIFVHEDYGESFPRVLNSSLIRFDRTFWYLVTYLIVSILFCTWNWKRIARIFESHDIIAL